MSDLVSPDVPISRNGFPLDGSAATYIYHNPPLNYSAVSGSLSLDPALPVLHDVPFVNPFPIPEWVGDGRLLPTTNLLAQQGNAHSQSTAGEFHPTSYQGLAGEIDSLGRPLEQHRHAIEGHDMQSYAKSSTPSGVSSDQSCQSSDSSTVPDQIMSGSSTSAHENETTVTTLSTRTSLSQHGSGASYESTDRDRPVEGSAKLSSRIASAMIVICDLGFSGIEDLTAQFYTADLHDRPALADAQRVSRRRGLTGILTKLREHAKDDWTDWEAQGYREEIIRAAEDILSDEYHRFSEEDDARGSREGRNIVEQKRQFQEEVSAYFASNGMPDVLTDT